MSIRDFKVGDKIYVASTQRPVGAKQSERLVHYEVTKVGRKYLHVKAVGGYQTRRYQDINGRLVEVVDIGSPSVAYRSEKEYYDEQERFTLWHQFRVVVAINYNPPYGLSAENMKIAIEAITGDLLVS